MRRLPLLFAPLLLAACASPKSAPANEAEAPPAASADDASAVDGGGAAGAAPAEQAKDAAMVEESGEANGIGAGASPPPGHARGPSDEGDADEGARVAVISGGLDRDIIRRKAKDHASDLQGCVPRSLAQNPALSERLTIELRIDPEGRVSEAEAAEDSPFTLSEVQRCVLELAEGWSFPEAEQETSVTLELRLDP